MRKIFFVYLTVLIMNFGTANAATLVLESGQKITGPIIEQTDSFVMINVNGMPSTFFLGEITSIDGKKVEEDASAGIKAVSAAKATATARAEIKKAKAPFYNDEEVSLIRFMKVRSTNTTVQSSVTPPAPVSPPAAAPATAPAVTPPVPAAAPSDPPTLKDFLGSFFSGPKKS